MTRSLTAHNLLNKKDPKTLSFRNDVFEKAIGPAEVKGCWLIYGAEKNGKTWFALKLAKDLALGQKISYISAEEGTDKSFLDACKRASITSADKILFDEYLSIEEIIIKFKKPKTARIIFIDNLTIYSDELKTVGIRDLMRELPNKLIVCLAHEERKEPYPSAARMCKKLSKVIFHVQGLRASVTSRFCDGGIIDIDPSFSKLYWGLNQY
jgi:predicted ATP-dependent serine protease